MSIKCKICGTTKDVKQYLGMTKKGSVSQRIHLCFVCERATNWLNFTIPDINRLIITRAKKEQKSPIDMLLEFLKRRKRQTEYHIMLVERKQNPST